MQKNYSKYNYNITIIKKQVKNLTISIKANGGVVVTAPRYLSNEYIDKFISLKQNWIEKKIQKIISNNTLIKYKNGDKVSFLGKKYTLKIKASNKNYVKLENNKLILEVEKNEFFLKEKILYDWYKLQAKKIFSDIVEFYLNLTNQSIKLFRIRRMKTRWGSCNIKKKYLNLNLDLIKYDKKAIEYVILHEIAHLTHPNHSKSFYNYISNYMPDFKERKKLLD